MKKIPFKIEKNEDGSFAVIENPTSAYFGNTAFNGDKVVRSPFDSMESARERMKEIGNYWEYEPIEITN